MTFAAFETSQENAQPIELYEFRLGSEVFRFTSNEKDVTIAANVYEAVAIQRGKISATSDKDLDQDQLTVEMPSDVAFVQKFIVVAPGKNATLLLRRYHRNDPDLQLITLFEGAIHLAGFNDESRRAVLQIVAPTAAFGRTIPRHTYQGNCNHMLYDVRCKIDENSPASQKFLPVTAVSGSTITCTGAGSFGLSDFFVSGFVESGGDFRAVIDQSGDVLTLLVPFQVSPLNQTVRCQAGCKGRLVTDCQNKFNNVINYGGFPFVPLKNPFLGLD